MIDLFDLHQYILWTCEKEGKPISNFRVNAILYVIQKKHKDRYGQKLFEGRFVRQKYLPYVPEVYFKHIYQGSSPIIGNPIPKNMPPNHVRKEIDPEIRRLREMYAWDVYGEVMSIYEGKSNTLDSLVLSKYVLAFLTERKNPTNNLKLQKILYALQSNRLHCSKEPLFKDDFYAWHYGPVINKVYYEYCIYGNFPIRVSDSPELPEEIVQEVNPIIEELSALTTYDLMNITHGKGSAWDCVYNKGSGLYSVICKDLIAKEDIAF